MINTRIAIGSILLSTSIGVSGHELVDVEVVNTPNVIIDEASSPVKIVGPMFLPTELRSIIFRLSTVAGKNIGKKITFDDAMVSLHDISFVPTASTSTGVCQIRIRINDIPIKVMGWEKLGRWDPPGIVEEWEPPGSIVGRWEPPGGMPVIDLTPNDVLTVRLKTVNADPQAGGTCSADFVVLATVPNHN